ncbi:hypothetical protein JCM10212_003285 [Sporobolomyces blumeae]
MTHRPLPRWPFTATDRDALPKPANEFQEWFLEKADARQSRENDGEALSDWIARRDQAKTAANQDKRLARKDDIIHRLGLLGFSERECDNWDFRRHYLVAKTGPMSDRSWSTNVAPVLVRFLEQQRRYRKKQGFSDLRYNLRDEYPELRDGLNDSIFSQLPTIRAAVDDASNDSTAADLFVGEAYMELKVELEEERAQEKEKEQQEREKRREQEEHRASKGKTKGKKKHKVKDKSGSSSKKAKHAGSTKALDKGKGNASVATSSSWRKTSTSGSTSKSAASTSSSKAAPKSATEQDFIELSKLPIALPRLPPWIPRTEGAPLHATDEQLAAFLGASPLANFECTKCNQLHDATEIFDNLSNRWACSATGPGSSVQSHVDKSMRIRGYDAITWGDETIPLARMDADVLRLSLQLSTVQNTTPLVVDESMYHIRILTSLTDYGRDQTFVVNFDCKCNVGYIGMRNSKDNKSAHKEAYRHLVRHVDAAEPPSVRARGGWTPQFRRESLAAVTRVDPPRHYMSSYFDSYGRDPYGDIYDRYPYGGDIYGGYSSDEGYGMDYRYDRDRDYGYDYGRGYGYGYDSDGYDSCDSDARPNCTIM